MTFSHKRPSNNDYGITVAVWCGLSDRQISTKVLPIADSSRVKKVLLFRRRPFSGHPKVHQVLPPALIRWSSFLSLIWMSFLTLLASAKNRIYSTKDFQFAFGITAFPHGILARSAGTIAGVPAGVWWIGTDLYKQYKLPILGRLYRFLLRGSDLTLTMGKNSSRILIKDGWDPKRIRVLLNAHDLRSFRPNPKLKKIDVINVGRLDRDHKQLHILLYAIHIVAQKIPNVTCVFAGDGPDLKRLLNLRDKLNLHNNVHFLGIRKDIPDLLNQSRIFVMCSAWEGLPAAMVEALACGIPVIVPRVSDVTDLASDNVNSLVVNEPSAQKYADEIINLLSNNDKWESLHKGALETRRSLEADDPIKSAQLFWDRYFENINEPTVNPIS